MFSVNDDDASRRGQDYRFFSPRFRRGRYSRQYVSSSIPAGPPFSELSHQSCPFQEGYLRIFLVTFLQITCTCFPARFLVTIIFQRLSCQLITGRNTKLPTTLRALQQPVGKMFCGQEKATPTGWCCNNNATTTQSGKTTSVP